MSQHIHVPYAGAAGGVGADTLGTSSSWQPRADPRRESQGKERRDPGPGQEGYMVLAVRVWEGPWPHL